MEGVYTLVGAIIAAALAGLIGFWAGKRFHGRETTDSQPGIPDNLNSLHRGEEFIRNRSMEAIKADVNMAAHTDMIEQTMNLFNFFIRQNEAVDEDKETIQLLGIRIFNGLASALKLMFSGYYQTAALQGRDILETAFLLDYL
ncbi:MAG TPA: hypothetical protein ENI69_00165, partial [Rhodospirillales bacterium]|nr:hypothetical protein [Rhodospirillales bacterium]